MTEREYNFKCIVRGVRFYPGLALLHSFVAILCTLALVTTSFTAVDIGALDAIMGPQLKLELAQRLNNRYKNPKSNTIQKQLIYNTRVLSSGFDRLCRLDHAVKCS